MSIRIFIEQTIIDRAPAVAAEALIKCFGEMIEAKVASTLVVVHFDEWALLGLG